MRGKKKTKKNAKKRRATKEYWGRKKGVIMKRSQYIEDAFENNRKE